MPRKSTRLVYDANKRKVVTRVEHEWQGIERYRALGHLWDRILALAELPPNEELRQIWEISCQNKLPSILRRASPSPLETLAVMLITTLADSSSKEWKKTISRFLVQHGWRIDTPGRPIGNPKLTKVFCRGQIIVGIIERLKPGFQMKKTAEQVRLLLRSQCYDEDEIKAIRSNPTLEGAAFSYYRKKYKDKASLKTIGNGWSIYKRLQKTPSTS